MAHINVDLEDGLPPVSFALREKDTVRYVKFMRECQELREEFGLALRSNKACIDSMQHAIDCMQNAFSELARRRVMQASEFAALLSEIVDRGMLPTDGDLRDRVNQILSDNEAHLAAAMAVSKE